MIPSAVDGDELARRLAAVRARIEAAGGDPDEVTVVGVTKGFDSSAVDVATAAGLVDLGESYAQEMVRKAAAAPLPVRWHWVGRLQRNKVRQVAAHVHLWHSVDRAELGAEIAKRAPGARVLAQVDTAATGTQGGCPPEEVPALVDALCADGLDVRGLMTIGARGAAASQSFRVLRRLADDLGLPERSMGMSADLEAAVAEGATMVRVGTALFGARSAGGSDRSRSDG